MEDGRMHENGCNFEWQCCTGTFPEDVAEYSNMLYYHDEGGLYISQYLNSCVVFEIENDAFSLENTSFYPKEKQLRFRLCGKKSREFELAGTEKTVEGYGYDYDRI